jgi:hypothetical protein
MDWAVDGLDATVWLSFSAFDGLLDWAAAFDDDLVFGSLHKKHGSALALVIACNDFDLIAFFDVGLDAAHEIYGWME